MMAHTQKPDFVFPRNGRVHLNRRRASVQSTAGSRGVRISGSNAGYTMFQGSVKSTGYPLHSPVSPSLPLPYVTVCHQVSNALYQLAVFKMTTSSLMTLGQLKFQFEAECRMCVTGTFASVANKRSLHLEAHLETTQHNKNVQDDGSSSEMADCETRWLSLFPAVECHNTFISKHSNTKLHC